MAAMRCFLTWTTYNQCAGSATRVKLTKKYRIGEMEENKVCFTCGKSLPLVSFRKRMHNDGITYSYERTCRKCGEKKFWDNKKQNDPEYMEKRRKDNLNNSRKYNSDPIKVQRAKENNKKNSLRYKEYRLTHPVEKKEKTSCRIYIFSCNHCGKLYVSKTLQRKYCFDCLDKVARIRSYNAYYGGEGHNIKICKRCGNEYDFLISGTTFYCSQSCADASKYEYIKKQRREGRHKRRIKLRALYESIDPFDIFNRDKWICKICGCRTPKRLRGTFAPNAPELDHIIPVSKGGSHTPSNLQCCCRSCNSSKSNKLIGQLNLCI
jgi:5-methylcytosine-specific restriction endonuclease McrA